MKPRKIYATDKGSLIQRLTSYIHLVVGNSRESEKISLRNRLTENKPVITRGEQGGRSGEIGEGD